MISRLHRGEKRLVFCDSRARVEELAAALRELRRHARSSRTARSAATSAGRPSERSPKPRDCVIVATSTLELGIDVGDLDRVIQIDAPRRSRRSCSAWAARAPAGHASATACSSRRLRWSC